MAKKRNEENFFKLSPEQQAKSIEKETAELIKRLPKLRKRLRMHDEVSSELYNLSAEEVSTIGTTYAKAVRSGEISTPSSQRAYQKFIRDIRKYTRPSLNQIAREVARQRFDDWLKTIKDHASAEEIAYVDRLVAQMDDSMKEGFTKSSYFIDNANWGSEQTFLKDTIDGVYSIQTLELELFLENHHPEVETDSKYNTSIATDGKMKKRKGIRRLRR